MASILTRCMVLAANLLAIPLSHAAAPAGLHEKADALRLGEAAYWRLLLRYEAADTASGWRSETGSPHFFLSPGGRERPADEVHALLDALFQPGAAPDKAVACNFPARTAWLQEQLGFTAPPADCPLLMQWKTAINPAQATLVFASDYLNNPSSMFGHTFLRLDAPEQTEDTRLLAYAVNFAANAAGDDPLTFTWKGMTGGYPGVFSVMPYYDKVKEYSDLENRDLWEYQLSFTPAELQRLLDHLWELRSVEFPYFFLTRNCSYQLLALFEAARPGLSLRPDFPLQAIPTDTVRRTLEEPGLLRQLVYRPSQQRRLLHDTRDNPGAVNRAARQLARQPDARTELTPAEEATALEAAYDYRYYLFLDGDQTPEARRQLRELLVRRSTLPVPDQRTPPPQPEVDPASGHATARFAAGVGRDREAGYLALRLRPAYHDLLDPPGGYRHGAHIDFLDTEIRLEEDGRRLRLESLNVIDIESLTAWDTFFRPWSWFFGVGYRQAAIDGKGAFATDESHGVTFVDGGAGLGVNAGRNLDCYLQAAATVEAGKSLAESWRSGVGPRGGCLYTRSRTRIRLQSDSRYYDDISALENRVTLEGQLDVSGRSGLRLQIGLLQSRDDDALQGELSWHTYF